MAADKHYFLTHYTDKAGYEGILASQAIRASVIDSIKSTHYGKGVYFSPIGPAEIGILGTHDFITRIFAQVTKAAVEKTQYYITVKADPNWYPMAALDPKEHFEIDDIWLVEQSTDLSIKDHIVEHGQTSIGHGLDAIQSDDPCRDYAYRVNEEWKESKKPKEEPAPMPVKRKSKFVFIDGQTVVRPVDWDEDFLLYL